MNLDIYIYQQLLLLETWHTPWMDQLMNFLGNFFGFNFNLIVWLENGHLYIPETASATDFNPGTHQGWSIQDFLVNFFGVDLNLYQYLMVWLEIWHLHISANTCARDLKLGTHLGGSNSRFFEEFFCGLTWTCTCT